MREAVRAAFPTQAVSLWTNYLLFKPRTGLTPPRDPLRSLPPQAFPPAFGLPRHMSLSFWDLRSKLGWGQERLYPEGGPWRSQVVASFLPSRVPCVT